MGRIALASSANLTRSREAGRKLTFDPTAIDVEGFEDRDDLLDGVIGVEGPVDDVQIFPARLEPQEDVVDQCRVPEGPLEEAEVAVVEFDPEGPALEVFEPAPPAGNRSSGS